MNTEAGPVFFTDLEAHLARDAVFVVAEGTSIEECARAIAEDDVERVQALIVSKLLRKPSSDERISWGQDPTRTWLAVVVQPYVLVQ